MVIPKFYSAANLTTLQIGTLSGSRALAISAVAGEPYSLATSLCAEGHSTAIVLYERRCLTHEIPGCLFCKKKLCKPISAPTKAYRPPSPNATDHLGHIKNSEYFGPALYQQKVLRRPGRTARRMSDWMKNDKAIRAFVERQFPKLHDQEHHRRLAALWTAVIVLYFRIGLSDTDVEHELNLRAGRVGRIVQSIRLAEKGLRLDGRQRTGRPRGRPKKTEIAGNAGTLYGGAKERRAAMKKTSEITGNAESLNEGAL